MSKIYLAWFKPKFIWDITHQIYSIIYDNVDMNKNQASELMKNRFCADLIIYTSTNNKDDADEEALLILKDKNGGFL